MDDFLKGFLSGTEINQDPLTKWVEWKHISMGKSHCPTCLKLDGGWYAAGNKPELPQHPYCHCTVYPIKYAVVVDQVQAQSAYSKFDPYLFDTDGLHPNGKRALFESWGYTAADARWLQKEMEQQAQYKYAAGEYILGKLDKNGQRITIRIELARKNGSGMVSFQSGWMVHPDGVIRLTTPYGGK